MGEQTAAAWYGESLGPLFVSHGSFAKLLLLDVVCHATNSFNIDPSRHFQRTKNGEVSTFLPKKRPESTAWSAIKILEKIPWKLACHFCSVESWPPSVLVMVGIYPQYGWCNPGFSIGYPDFILKSRMNLMLKSMISHHFKAA
jgi:hypothetical protein